MYKRQVLRLLKRDEIAKAKESGIDPPKLFGIGEEGLFEKQHFDFFDSY